MANQTQMEIAAPAQPASQADTPPVPCLDGYRLLKPLGHGGQGHVFQALRLTDNQKVAIKFILPGRLGDLASRARFEEEWRTLELLNHPSIVRVLDHGTLDSGELWYAAEYIDGVPVNQYVHDLDRVALARAATSSRPAFPLKKVLDLFVLICQGVEAAHQAGVLHRDLKPANILVDDDGRPHILDFGLARGPLRESPDAVTLTGQFMGSPAWSSPEQIEARPSLIDARTDVYSLGMMLYHALTGDFPFDVNQPWPQLFETIRTGRHAPPRDIRPFIDDDLQTVILTAIAGEKTRRYASVAALREDIQRYRAGRPILARPDSGFYRLAKFVQRNRLLVAAIAVVVLLTLGYAVSMTYMYRRAEHHATDARAKFRAARDMLDFTLSQVDSELGKVAGASNVRRSILEKAYAQLDTLLRETTDDPALQADIAKTHSRLADIAQGLGRLDRAAEGVAAALDIRRKLAAEHPNDHEAQAELSIALVRVGDITCAQGDRPRGHALYEQALAIDEALVAANPENLHYLDNLSWSYDRLCWAAIFDGDDPRASEFHEKRLALARRLVELEPANPARKRNLLLAYVQGASVPGNSGPSPEGESQRARIEAADKLATELLAAEPDNLEYQRGFVISRRVLANVTAREGGHQQACNLMREPRELILQVLAAEPENRDWSVFFVVTLRELARFHLSSPLERTAAESLLREADERASTLDARLPNDVQIKDMVACTKMELGQLLWDSGRLDEARALYREVIRLQRELVACSAAEPDHYRSLAEVLTLCPAEDLREPAAAIEVALQGVERTRRRSVHLLSILALAQKANGDVSEARQTTQEALALLRPGSNPLRDDLEAFLATLP
ncbi:MAG: hypothetical protein DCC65_07950 [Planctomycetota bacterium]|nr:MAG: hypothetical protein DCC65_07950 [Planctomycetota bacterium]